MMKFSFWSKPKHFPAISLSLDLNIEQKYMVITAYDVY